MNPSLKSVYNTYIKQFCLTGKYIFYDVYCTTTYCTHLYLKEYYTTNRFGVPLCFNYVQYNY